jgi:hypothetical protein
VNQVTLQFVTRRWTSWLLAAVISVAICNRTSAQSQQGTSFGPQERLLEEQLRPLIQPEFRTPAADNGWLFDYGGVLRYTGLWFEDHGPSAGSPFVTGGQFQGFRAAHDFDFRPWASASLDGVHYGFVRGQIDFLQYGSGDEFDRNSDWRGPFVDLGFYRLDIDEAMRQYHGCEIDRWSADLTLGRQFLYVGRGIAFSLVTDAASINWLKDQWSGFMLGGQSIRHFDNIDHSVPGFSRSDREFFGGQVNYNGWDHFKPYAYGVIQRDRSSERPPDPAQEYDYDSEYWGFGYTGKAVFEKGDRTWGNPNVHYFGEFIIETGDSFGIANATDQDPIASWAFDVGVSYHPQRPSKPRYIAEFARAAGDDDRASPNNTLIGNIAGTTDRGFLPFGYTNTGVSFAPYFANLEFARLGAACRPCPDRCEWNLKELEIGSNFFLFWRPAEDGGISDVRADLPGSSYLGSEVDLWVNWRMSSDVYLLVNYGHFFPDGDSFSVDNSRAFLTVNLTWLF